MSHDDDLAPVVIDLDAEPATDGPGGDPDDAETPQSSRWRWLAVPAVLVAGVGLGAYVAGLRADAEADSTVTVSFGGYDVQSWANRSADPISVGLQVLNPGPREVQVVEVSVPGLTDEELVSPPSDGGVTLAPGEWTRLRVTGQADCTVAELAPDTRGVLETAEITFTVEREGRATEITETGPLSSLTPLTEAVATACQPEWASSLMLHVAVSDIGEPADGSLRTALSVMPDSRDRGEVLSITSTMPGLTASVDGFPVELTGRPFDIDVVWTVDCATLGDPVSVALTVKYTTPGGMHQAGSMWLGNDVSFALGRLAARTCDPATDGG